MPEMDWCKTAHTLYKNISTHALALTLTAFKKTISESSFFKSNFIRRPLIHRPSCINLACQKLNKIMCKIYTHLYMKTKLYNSKTTYKQL